MSEATKHTPGPLKAFKGTEDDPDRWLVVVDGPKPWHVATVENGAPGDTLETEAANARLFAAAPDLLKVCRGLSYHFPRSAISPRDPRLELVNNLLAAAEAAIQKATAG